MMDRLAGGAMLVALATGLMAIASCQPLLGAPTPTPSPTVCDGVSSEMGGCDGNRHTFVASTCVELGEEWARELDRRVVDILLGPQVVNSNGRSVRLRQALVVVTVDMNTRLTALGLVAECDMPEFLGAAEPLFSQELRSGVGAALFENSPPATYEEWLADVRKVVRMIDQGEA